MTKFGSLVTTLVSALKTKKNDANSLPRFQDFTDGEFTEAGMKFFFASKGDPVAYETPFGSRGKRYEAVDINSLFKIRPSDRHRSPL
jgi:hypothetical protein